MAEETPSRSERARRAILNAAHTLFIRQGYAATSMRQIAKIAGMAPGSLYNHFSSKEEMFTAILSERHPLIPVLTALNNVEGRTVEEFCRNAARGLVAQLEMRPDFLNLALIEIVEFNTAHAMTIVENFKPRMVPLGQRLAELEGRVRDMPPFTLARAFLGMFFSFYITGKLMGKSMPLDEAGTLDHFVDIYLHGILAEEKL